MVTKLTQKEEKLKADLFSSEEKTVLKALNKIGLDGTKNMVAPMLELLVHSSSLDIKQVVIDLLSQLKIGNTEEIFISKLKDPKYAEHHQSLISCMWNSGIMPTDDLDVVVEIAVNGDYMTALEVLTLIENMEGPFDHESLLDAFTRASEYVNEGTVDDPKLELIKSIYGYLYSFQEE